MNLEEIHSFGDAFFLEAFVTILCKCFLAGVHQDQLSVTMKTIKDPPLSPNDESLQKLLQDLKNLETSGDPSVFDVSTMTGAQLQVNLYELLIHLDSTSSVLWQVVSLLQKVCTQNTSKSTLSYRYMPILGKVLTESLTQEKKLKLLNLLQTLTYGISIQWQEPYLKPLLQSLCACVKSEGAKEATLSLSTLVNLLHRNPAVSCAFVRCVSPKEFIKQLLTSRHEKSVEFRLEMCKFMILTAGLMECNSSDKELNIYIGRTFECITKYAPGGSLSMLEHTVNFFADFCIMDKFKPTLLAYPRYESAVGSILKLVEESEGRREYPATLLRFLNSLVVLQPPKLAALMPKIAAVSAKILKSGEATARTPAMSLLLSLAQKSAQPEKTAVSHELEDVLPVLVGRVKEAIPRKEAIILFQLLCELTAEASIKKELQATLDPQVMRPLFDLVLGEWNENGVRKAVSVEDATWCVEALRLVNKLTPHAAWLHLFSTLAGQRGIQMALAAALKSAPAPVKSHVLAFPAMVGFPAQSVAALSHCLGEQDFSSEANSSEQPIIEGAPLFGMAEHNRLNNILSRLEAASVDEMARDLKIIFEYRQAEDAREQEILNASLAEANNRIASLMQRLGTLKGENDRVRRCLGNALESLQQAEVERGSALASAEAAKAAAKKDFDQNLEMKAEYETKLKELEKQIQQLQKSVEEKNGEVQNQAAIITSQASEIQTLKETNEANMERLAQKSNEIREKDEQIRNLEIIKTAIYEISGGTKKVD